MWNLAANFRIIFCDCECFWTIAHSWPGHIWCGMVLFGVRRILFELIYYMVFVWIAQRQTDKIYFFVKSSQFLYRVHQSLFCHLTDCDSRNIPWNHPICNSLKWGLCSNVKCTTQFPSGKENANLPTKNIRELTCPNRFCFFKFHCFRCMSKSSLSPNIREKPIYPKLVHERNDIDICCL